MTPPRSALSLLAAAAALGLGACGGSTEGGVPRSDADTLREELGDVERFVERGDCDEVDGQVLQVRNAVAELPNSVDPELRENFSEGVGRLESVVASDCQEQAEEAEEETEEEVTTTETTEPPEEEPPPEPEPQPEPELPTDELPPPEEGLPPGEFGP
ncbi:MAG: hypothetical protein M3459_09425 [Actinomycetota bacterium]|nr:hypothetical protein [Actinomycetota bacterium]